MGNLQDKINQRYPLTPEECAVQKAYTDRENALRIMMQDFVKSQQVAYGELTRDRREWWQAQIKSRDLAVEELVFGIEWNEKEGTGDITVVDIIQKTPDNAPSAVKRAKLESVKPGKEE